MKQSCHHSSDFGANVWQTFSSRKLSRIVCLLASHSHFRISRKYEWTGFQQKSFAMLEQICCRTVVSHTYQRGAQLKPCSYLTFWHHSSDFHCKCFAKVQLRGTLPNWLSAKLWCQNLHCIRRKYDPRFTRVGFQPRSCAILEQISCRWFGLTVCFGFFFVFEP